MEFVKIESIDEAFGAAKRRSLWVMQNDRFLKAYGFSETKGVSPSIASVTQELMFCSKANVHSRGETLENWQPCKLSELHERKD